MLIYYFRSSWTRELAVTRKNLNGNANEYEARSRKRPIKIAGKNLIGEHWYGKLSKPQNYNEATVGYVERDFSPTDESNTI